MSSTPTPRNIHSASGPTSKNSVTAINARNRAILYESNNPNLSFNPSVLNLLNTMPNDEASESRLFARASATTSERKTSTDVLLDHVNDSLRSSSSGSAFLAQSTPRKEIGDTTPTPSSFFRCCQCQHKSRTPTCQRPHEEIGVIQGASTQRILIVNGECAHEKCSRCVNVDEKGVRIGVKPWELEWRGPTASFVDERWA